MSALLNSLAEEGTREDLLAQVERLLAERKPTGSALLAPRAAAPAEPNALRRSIAELDAWLAGSDTLDEIENQTSFGESIWLVVDELKRLQAAQPSGALVKDLASGCELGATQPSDTATAFVPTHRHKKRGSVYRVIGEAEAQVSTGVCVPVFEEGGPRNVGKDWWERDLSDGDRLTIYQSADGKLWARFSDEFKDGRFEALDIPSGEAK